MFVLMHDFRTIISQRRFWVLRVKSCKIVFLGGHFLFTFFLDTFAAGYVSFSHNAQRHRQTDGQTFRQPTLSRQQPIILYAVPTIGKKTDRKFISSQISTIEIYRPSHVGERLSKFMFIYRVFQKTAPLF